MHQSCYGIRPLPPDGEWLCDLCIDDPVPPTRCESTACVLCGKRVRSSQRPRCRPAPPAPALAEPDKAGVGMGGTERLLGWREMGWVGAGGRVER